MVMDVEMHIQYWLTGAEADLIVAEDLIRRKHYAWALFIGHLVLEKTLKAMYVAKIQKEAPKTHSLLYLAKKSGLLLSVEQEDFLSSVTDYNIANRYPDMSHILQQSAMNQALQTILFPISRIITHGYGRRYGNRYCQTIHCQT